MKSTTQKLITIATALLNTNATRGEVVLAVNKAVTLLSTVRTVYAFEEHEAVELTLIRKSGSLPLAA